MFGRLNVQVASWTHAVIDLPFECTAIGEESIIHNSPHDHPGGIEDPTMP